MITNRTLFFSLLLLLCVGCNKPNPHREFVEKYGDENFDDFMNRSLFVREYHRGNPTVFVYDETQHQRPCDLFVGFVIDKKTNTIKEIRNPVVPDSCNIDIKTSGELAVRFSEYKISSLEMDSNKNVHIVVVFKERNPDRLIRFSDLQYKTEEYKDWVQVKGNWYEKKGE